MARVEHNLLLPVGFAWEPGNAGKSSLLIVNSEVSGVGCFTIPTKKGDKYKIQFSHN